MRLIDAMIQPKSLTDYILFQKKNNLSKGFLL